MTRRLRTGLTLQCARPTSKTVSEFRAFPPYIYVFYEAYEAVECAKLLIFLIRLRVFVSDRSGLGTLTLHHTL